MKEIAWRNKSENGGAVRESSFRKRFFQEPFRVWLEIELRKSGELCAEI
jgi:hypothetical protein